MWMQIAQSDHAHNTNNRDQIQNSILSGIVKNFVQRVSKTKIKCSKKILEKKRKVHQFISRQEIDCELLFTDPIENRRAENRFRWRHQKSNDNFKDEPCVA